MILNPYTGINMPDASMEPLIPEGAALHVQSVEYINSGSIVVAVDAEDNFVIRRYVKLKDSFILTADNSKFEPIEEIENYKVVGVVKSYQKEV